MYSLVIGYMDTAWDSLEGDERRLLVVVAASEPRGASVVFFLRLGAITAHVCGQARCPEPQLLIYQLKTQPDAAPRTSASVL